MNWRNYHKRNVLGEARMHSQLKVIEILQQHYATKIPSFEPNGTLYPEIEEGMEADQDDANCGSRGDAVPDRTVEAWMAARQRAIPVSKLNEWTQCIEPDTGI